MSACMSVCLLKDMHLYGHAIKNRLLSIKGLDNFMCALWRWETDTDTYLLLFLFIKKINIDLTERESFLICCMVA